MPFAKGITIRAERPGDASAITDLVWSAYADVVYSDHNEHAMIEQLRETDAFVPGLSLLAMVNDELAGHLLLTRAHIRDGNAAVETLALAPLSVAPAYQRQGVGRCLVEAAHERAAGLGFGSIVVVGIPGYYPRFGYEPMSDYPITLPFEAPSDHCMILPLRTGALSGVRGVVEYADAWLNH